MSIKRLKKVEADVWLFDFDKGLLDGVAGHVPLELIGAVYGELKELEGFSVSSGKQFFPYIFGNKELIEQLLMIYLQQSEAPYSHLDVGILRDYFSSFIMSCITECICEIDEQGVSEDFIRASHPIIVCYLDAFLRKIKE